MDFYKGNENIIYVLQVHISVCYVKNVKVVGLDQNVNTIASRPDVIFAELRWGSKTGVKRMNLKYVWEIINRTW